MYNHQIYFFTATLFLISNLVIGAPRNFKMRTNTSSRWSNAGHTIQARAFHAASSLIDGRVLFTGGDSYDACMTTEFYNPSTGKWTAGKNMNDCRWFHTSTLLNNEKVLVTGGLLDDPEHDKNVKIVIAVAELFDPTTGTWTYIYDEFVPRIGHTASVLPNGTVILVGGMDYTFQNTALVYDPVTESWSGTNSMHWSRVWHTATTLGNGKLLVTGGMSDENDLLKTAELYDPLTEKWKIVGNMSYSRCGHTATLLTNGKVLVIGGHGDNGDSINSTELLDPSTETWALSGRMHNIRAKHTASLLKNEKVLVAGGGTGGGFPGLAPVSTSEIYDPSTGIWTHTNNMHYARVWHTASVLENGNVLVVGGGTDAETGLYIAELYNSSTSSYVRIDGFEHVQYLHKDFASTNEHVFNKVKRR